MRHKDKDICPSLLDISCAGHLQSGEQVEDGLRELEEELGIIAPFDDLLYCGMVAQENQYNEHLIDREFNHIFLYENAEHKELAGYQFQLSEISGLFWIDFKEFEELVNGNIDRVQAEGIIVNETEGIIEDSMKTCSIADFTPKSDIYYTLLFKKIIEFIKTDH
ncbi:isopentenyl-diphosphate delta-isomerase [compost metagenome]